MVFAQYRKELFCYFHLLAMLWIIMQYSLVKLVVDGIAAQEIDNQLEKQSFPVLNWNIDGSSTTFAKNDNCVPQRLRDQPRKNENNLKEYWTQLTLRMRKTTRARFPVGFLIFSYPWFSHTYPHSNWICSSTRIRPYPDYFCYPWLLWEYWKLRMRRGSHLEYNIHGTTDLGISGFSVHTRTIPDS